MERKNIRCFKPFIFEDSRILVLGSAPSEKSLEQGFYYGHAQNRFWKVMARLTGEEDKPDWDYRKDMLKRHAIALYDVIAACSREGSLDAKIKDVVPSDIDALLSSYPAIEVIALNGAKAKEVFLKHSRCGFAYIALPSTSPIPRKNVRTFDELYSYWSVLEKWVKPLDGFQTGRRVI